MLTAAAHAKITLFLHVTGKRESGYHELDALVAFTQAGDTVSVQSADALTLEVEGPYAEQCGAMDQNLVLRAAKLLQVQTARTQGAKITLTKKLPVAAGLGGGSSDAATALKLLCRLWSLPLSPAELAEMALPLGSDLPVCIHAAPARMTGIGEKVTPIASMQPMPVLLVNPNIPLSTPDVYAAYHYSPSPYVSPQINTDDPMALLIGLERTHNHLQSAAISLVPEIAPMLLEIQQQLGCRLARLCGSGPTCYALFESSLEMAHAAISLRNAHPNWWVCETKLLPRAAWAVA